MAMRSRTERVSDIFASTEEFTPRTWRLDVVPDLVSFLNTPNEGLWLVKHSNSNQGRGVEMVRDIGRYKEDLLNRKDKWGDSAGTPDSTELLM